MSTTTFKGTPHSLVTQMVGLFEAPVYMLNATDQVVASSEPEAENKRHAAAAERWFRVPYCFNDQTGTILIQCSFILPAFNPVWVETIVHLLLEKAYLMEQLPDQH